MHCRCNVLINHITRSMMLTIMMTVCMMNSRHSRLLPTMLLLHSIHDILSAARHLRWMRKMMYIGIHGIGPYIWDAIKAGRSLARNSAGVRGTRGLRLRTDLFGAWCVASFDECCRWAFCSDSLIRMFGWCIFLRT